MARALLSPATERRRPTSRLRIIRSRTTSEQAFTTTRELAPSSTRSSSATLPTSLRRKVQRLASTSSLPAQAGTILPKRISNTIPPFRSLTTTTRSFSPLVLRRSTRVPTISSRRPWRVRGGGRNRVDCRHDDRRRRRYHRRVHLSSRSSHDLRGRRRRRHVRRVPFGSDDLARQQAD